MRATILSLLLFAALGLFAQETPVLDYPQPEYVNPIYDCYSHNYLSTRAMGRGNTGAGLMGAVDHLLLNPAGYLPEKGSLHLELLVKPQIDNNYYRAEVNYNSPVPIGSAGFGGKLGGDFSGALLYSNPKSISVDDFQVPMNFGYYVYRFITTFNLQQITANLGWHKGNWNLGLNLHNQIYYVDEPVILGSFEKQRDYKYFLRPQLGVLYSTDILGAGITFTPSTNADWDLKFVQYDSVLPLQLTLGGAVKFNDNCLAADLDYENTAAISDQFSDRLRVKLGWEKTVRRFTYRLGYINSPEVWSGTYRLPEGSYDIASGDSVWWNPLSRTGVVSENNQHLLTGGVTWKHRDIEINLSGLMDVGGKAELAHVGVSIDLYFSAFKKKGFLYFD